MQDIDARSTTSMPARIGAARALPRNSKPVPAINRQSAASSGTLCWPSDSSCRALKPGHPATKPASPSPITAESAQTPRFERPTNCRSLVPTGSSGRSPSRLATSMIRAGAHPAMLAYPFARQSPPVIGSAVHPGPFIGASGERFVNKRLNEINTLDGLSIGAQLTSDWTAGRVRGTVRA
mgnify:CR=1 FL=1